MKFPNLLIELAKLNLPSDQYAITGSGPLAVRGLREAHDLDIIVSKKLFNELSRKYPIKKGPPCDKINLGNIELLGNFEHYQKNSLATTHEQINSADIINGIRYLSLELTKQFKQKSARPYDLEDIKLINDYLSQKDHYGKYVRP